jgi:hypothetical protein
LIAGSRFAKNEQRIFRHSDGTRITNWTPANQPVRSPFDDRHALGQHGHRDVDGVRRSRYKHTYDINDKTNVAAFSKKFNKEMYFGADIPGKKGRDRTNGDLNAYLNYWRGFLEPHLFSACWGGNILSYMLDPNYRPNLVVNTAHTHQIWGQTQR